MSEPKLSIEDDTRIGVAQHKPCAGCGRSWDDCGGGWVDLSCEVARWRCDDCVPPADVCSIEDCTCRAKEHVTREEMDRRCAAELAALGLTADAVPRSIQRTALD